MMADNNETSALAVKATCVACGWCKFICPVANCITFEMDIATIHHTLCIECNRCVYVCPVDAIQPVKEIQPHRKQINAGKPEGFDVVVIGAGIGGMLAACQLAQASKRVLLVENLSFLGGRFSGFPVHNSVLSSGALHTIPHGGNGPFAHALRRSGISINISSSNVFASFHINGKHIIAQNPFDALKIYPNMKDRISVIRGLIQCRWTKDYKGSYGDWTLKIGLSEPIRTTIDKFFQFAISNSMDNLPYREGRKVIEMIFKYGFPGVPIGGAREVSRQLGVAIKSAGVDIRKNTQAQNLVLDNDRVCGVTLLDRRQNKIYTVKTPIIISNIGPGNTLKMWEKSFSSRGYGQILPHPPPAAVGFKLQVLSPKSLLEHKSIMFCVDTQRVAGIVQVSNSDPQLAPLGKHLLMSHQTMHQGSTWQEEYQQAIEDWRYVFGRDFDNCQVLGSSAFPSQFPVNWASQGYDWRDQILSGQGLWFVGDGMKPEGLMMVEGVAASAESVVQQILKG